MVNTRHVAKGKMLRVEKQDYFRSENKITTVIIVTVWVFLLVLMCSPHLLQGNRYSILFALCQPLL